MKTAMQTLINDIEIMCPNAYKKIHKLFELKKYYLELEKQQIMEANTVGVNQGLYGYRNAEEYYNTTFKKK